MTTYDDVDTMTIDDDGNNGFLFMVIAVMTMEIEEIEKEQTNRNALLFIIF